MPGLELDPSSETLEANARDLSESQNPGNLLAIGRGIGNKLILLCAITGTDELSQDRDLVEDRDGVRIVSHTKSAEEMKAEPLARTLYFRPIAKYDDLHVASNGVQTTRIRDYMLASDPLESAVRLAAIDAHDKDLPTAITGKPDFIHTIAAAINVRQDRKPSTPFGVISNIKELESGKTSYSKWDEHDFDNLGEELGYYIPTYNNWEGQLQPHESGPAAIRFGSTSTETAESVWDLMNKDTRVAVAATEITIPGPSYHILNRRG